MGVNLTGSWLGASGVAVIEAVPVASRIVAAKGISAGETAVAVCDWVNQTVGDRVGRGVGTALFIGMPGVGGSGLTVVQPVARSRQVIKKNKLELLGILISGIGPHSVS